jgi:hypothetical protein
MTPENNVWHRNLQVQSVINHGLSASTELFRGLEKKDKSAGPSVLVFYQCLGSSEKACNMHVVAASLYLCQYVGLGEQVSDATHCYIGARFDVEGVRVRYYMHRRLFFAISVGHPLGAFVFQPRLFFDR